MITAGLSFLSWHAIVVLVSLVLVFGGLVWYALRTKGDVQAVFSHGRTVLKLEVKERSSTTK